MNSIFKNKSRKIARKEKKYYFCGLNSAGGRKVASFFIENNKSTSGT